MAKDALLDAELRDRLYYETGVLLDATDLRAEQAYHRGRLARALAYLHGTGTAAGLFVTHKPPSAPNLPDEEELEVAPGIAVDTFGRLIEVPAAACIKLHRWYWQSGLKLADYGVFVRDSDPGPDNTKYHLSPDVNPASVPPTGVVADLFLRFREAERGKTPAFATGAFDALDTVVPARVREGYELRLVPRSVANPPPRPPASPFPTLETVDPDERRSILREAIFQAWRGDRRSELEDLWNDAFLPPSLRFDEEGEPIEDPAWVFLARVVLGATSGTTSMGSVTRPTRTTQVYVDNNLRPFSVTNAALARFVGAQ